MNSDLKDKTYNVTDELKKFLGPTISYHNIKMMKSRMEKAKLDKNIPEFKRRGGEEALKWLNNTLKTDRDALYNQKKAGMDAGRDNQFIKTHEKDNNVNPTAISRIPKVNKGDMSRKIMTNKEVYNEDFKKEIEEIRYLIEYMNNNKKQKL